MLVPGLVRLDQKRLRIHLPSVGSKQDTLPLQMLTRLSFQDPSSEMLQVWMTSSGKIVTRACTGSAGSQRHPKLEAAFKPRR